MSHLLRIIQINGHLEGVLELSLDGHTNICGTNASGKTTLQRLVPVFYGELPNKVVPKTRKKFDQFYLPHSNSYLIYEYRREEGDLCQAVLTRSSDGGVDYRFIKAGFASQHYLIQETDGLRALSYAEWASGLRQNKIIYSNKLNATSEYRSVIQNDFSLLRGSSRESRHLRQLAAQFSLVKSTHRIRHLEKLVSAVHAKEGKLDTLKTMLAAIFEEEGVELPVTGVRTSKAKQWIQEMRQSTGLAELQKEFQSLNAHAQELAATEAELWRLHPHLIKDAAYLQQSLADEEAQVEALGAELKQQERLFSEQLNDQNASLSKTTSELRQAEQELEDIHSRYDYYSERDLPGLAADLKQLPAWREELQQLEKHLQLMRDELGDSLQKLETRKLELAQNLEQRTRQVYQQIQSLQQQKELRREEQGDEERELQAVQEQRLEQERSQFQAQQAQLLEQLFELRAQLKVSQQTAAEAQELDLAQVRIDQAQQDQQARAQTLDSLRQEAEVCKDQRRLASEQLNQISAQLQQAEQRWEQLRRQQDPEQGSLRYFLRAHQPGWELSLGKVLSADLLERCDLSPQQAAAGSEQIFNLQLDLNAIELPDYARDEQSLALAFQAAEQRVEELEVEKQSCSKQLSQANQRFKEQELAVDEARRQLKQSETEILYAQEARQRLLEQQQQLEKQRREHWQQQQHQLEAEKSRLEHQQEQVISALRQDYLNQLMEFKADWQEQLQAYDQQISQQQQQLQALRDEQQQQLAELEAAFNQELQARQRDPKHLREVEERLEERRLGISRTLARRDELDDYERFIRVDWKKRKPDLVQAEARLKQQKRQQEQALEELQQQYKTAQAALKRQLNLAKQACEDYRRLSQELHPLLSRLDALPQPESLPAPSQQPGDLTERLVRVNQGLLDRDQQTQQLAKKRELFEQRLIFNASSDFIGFMDQERQRLGITSESHPSQYLPLLADLLQLLEDKQQQLVAQGRNLGGDLNKFFTVFRDLNRRINLQSQRLSQEVADDLLLEGISKSEVKIHSTIDELGFWKPLQHFASLYKSWTTGELPSNAYLNALADVVDLLRSDQSYTFASLLRLELHLNEGGSDLIIRNDRQLLESSSQGMAYLILCKFLLAFTRLLRGPAEIAIHWPIDEIGTLAYHNVEKLFKACENNRIHIVGAFPNPESDVLLLFQHRYLIDRDPNDPNRRQLKRIEPQLSRLAQRLAQKQQEEQAC